MMKKINLLILMFLISFSMLTANPLQKVAEKTFLIDEIDGAETLGTFFEKLYYSDFDNSIYITGQFATNGLKETFGSYGRQACLIKMNDKLEIEWIQSEFFSQTDTISRHVVFDINENQNKLEIILAYTTSSTENKNADYFYLKKIHFKY